MRAMLLERTCSLREETSPLILADLPRPQPTENEVLLEVHVCGVCHTELDEIEGRTPPPRFPMVLGHQVVGRVAELAKGVQGLQIGERVGVAWIHSACGTCAYCRDGQENLCPDFVATGRDAPGGYAEYLTAPAPFLHPIPDGLADDQAAPLLCAGAIGYRSLRLTGMGNGDRLGLTGFGASGHLMLQMVRYRFPDSEVYVFARNPQERAHALQLGATWAGPTEAMAPKLLHAIIDTTPAWKPVRAALEQLRPGGRLVINAIRKEAGDQEELQNRNYARDLWLEKEIKSVANVTRQDVHDMLDLAAEAGFQPDRQSYALEQANEALMDLLGGKGRRAKILRVRSA